MRRSKSKEQVVETNASGFKIDKMKILQIYHALSEEESADETAMKKNLAKKQKTTKNNAKEPNKFAWIGKDKIAQIERFLQKYGATLNDDDSSLSRSRKAFKVELFRYCYYGLQEIIAEQKEINEDVIFDGDKSYDHVKQIVNGIDEAFFNIKNKGELKEQKREFIKQWKYLLQNIKDEKNSTLRAKIITQLLTPEDLAEMAENDFYSKEKLEIIKKKQRRILAQSEVDFEKMGQQNDMQEEKQYHEEYYMYPRNGMKFEEDEIDYKEIENWLHDAKLKQIKAWIRKELEGAKTKRKIVSHFSRVFSLRQ